MMLQSDYKILKISKADKNYPQLLSQITDPPKQLYCRGNVDLLNSECVGIVGTRKLTPYGKEAGQYITRGLTTVGFTIVSGLAIGIDSVAHKTTLDTGGKTIAVLGSGINNDSIYPQLNLKLATDILSNDGLIISEYPEATPGLKHHFPARNRIISGLSRGVVVIEADKESGSLITAKCALDQNRDVFAVPGNIFSSKSAGSNNLIQSGAKLIMSAQDVIEEYGHNLNIFLEQPGAPSTKNSLQKNILAILEHKGESSADEIISYLPTKNTSDILSSLSMLEISGLISNSSSGKYFISK